MGLERNRIISNDYADLLVPYYGNQYILEGFDPEAIHILNFFYAVIHIPVEQISEDIIARMGYSSMPALYGLINEASLEASGIVRLRNIPGLNLRGQGVLIGIIDTGIDYTNPVFQYADNTTRIVSIWDQTISSDDYPEGFYYGTEYTNNQINNALQNENPLEIVPSEDEIGHGTMIAGIAGGNSVPESEFSGVAPDAEIVVVKLKQAKPYLKDFFCVPEDAICYQTNDIMTGVDYVLKTADRLNRPLVICIGLGTSQGPHDGSGPLDSYISHQAEYVGVTVVIAAGNEGNARSHFFGVVDPTIGYQQVELIVGEDESGFSMELWGESPNTYSIDIMSPYGEYESRITARLQENRVISYVLEKTIIYLDYQMVEAESGEQLILVRFQNPTPGNWKFNVYARGDLPQSFHIWLPITGFISENTFFVQSNPFTTITSPGNSFIPITVTAYNHEDDSLNLNASRGYTRIEKIKPEIAAPGVNLLSPILDKGFTYVTGSSSSAAYLAGVVAMILEWGIVKGHSTDMTTLAIKNFLIRGARRDIDKLYPNRDWGYGILDVFNVFNALRIEI